MDGAGKRYRLPKGSPAFDETSFLGPERIDREICAERDIFNCHGTFYELPADNAGGFAKIRPIATHNRRISDFCTWRGLFVLTGIDTDPSIENRHIIRSDDGKCAVWWGALDDLWQFGKAVGYGGPWKNSHVSAGVPSDPYLTTGYDKKTLMLSHDAARSVRMDVEVDIDGTGNWKLFRSIEVPPNDVITYRFPEAFAAYWLRVTTNLETTATAQLLYE